MTKFLDYDYGYGYGPYHTPSHFDSHHMPIVHASPEEYHGRVSPHEEHFTHHRDVPYHSDFYGHEAPHYAEDYYGHHETDAHHYENTSLYSSHSQPHKPHLRPVGTDHYE